jgi:hypothetical protein
LSEYFNVPEGLNGVGAWLSFLINKIEILCWVFNNPKAISSYKSYLNPSIDHLGISVDLLKG